MCYPKIRDFKDRVTHGNFVKHMESPFKTHESYLCYPQTIDLDEIGEIPTFQQLHLDIELPGECSSTFGSTAGEFPTGFGGSANYGDHGIRD